MRNAIACRFLFPFVAVIAAAACGSNTLPNTNDDLSVPDMTAATADMKVPPDMSAPKPDFSKPPKDLFDPADYGGVSCGAQTCSGGNVCCIVQGSGDAGISQTCMSSCPDGGITESCDGPEDCQSGAPYCCAKLDIGPGNAPACPINSAVAACANACDSMLPSACPGMATFRLCHHEADCADDQSGYNSCCELQQGGNKIRVCVNSLIIAFANPQCF